MPRTPLLFLAFLAMGFFAMACEGEDEKKPADGKAAEAPPSAAGPAAEKAAPERVSGVTYDEHGTPVGLHRYHKWSAKVGQGAQPEGDEAFKNLKALGYRTILSVDGSVPDVEGAQKHGLRYIHVPIGYDGVTKELALRIVAAARLSPEPIFVHCHHGKHRGPAAAMICRISEDKVSSDEAVKGLEASGTSKNYTGLWRDVQAFKTPSAEEIATVKDLPSKVLPKGLRAGMVDVNVRFEHLTLAQQNGWKPLKDHPDMSPPHEARMLWELYRELARSDTECRDKGEIFLAYMKAAEDAGIELEISIRAGDAKAADKHYTAIKNGCADCHRDYRN